MSKELFANMHSLQNSFSLYVCRSGGAHATPNTLEFNKVYLGL